MKEEIKSLEKNHTWVLVDKPKNQKVVGNKWVYKRKYGIPGVKPTTFKARLVAKGFTQQGGIDYNEVFSPLVKYTSIRVLLALTAQFDMNLEQLDVKTAFLHGELEEKIFMQQPEGFVENSDAGKVCLLKNSLYGLTQSPRQWYKRFDDFMIKSSFNRSSYDSCVYYKVLPGNNFIYLLLYVDDMLIACKNNKDINRVKAQLMKEFEMKDLGHTKKILGMDIVRNRKKETVFLSQRGYLQKVLKRFEMLEAKPVLTPLAQHFKLSVSSAPGSEEERAYMERVPYANVVGSIMYAMVYSRPDLAHSVSVVSHFMENPKKLHW